MKPLSDRVIGRLRASATAPDLTGTRYRLLEPVGRGGMGAVYLAEDTQLGRRVALKVLDLPDPGGALARRLMQEARVLARLEHPGIVPVHDVGTLADGRVFYTMKYVQGRRLDEHRAQVPALPDRLRIFQRICEAVAFAHAHGVLHRDLKPENVMGGPFGEVLVMDWGVAKILDDPAGTRETIIAAAQRPVQEVPGETAHGAVLGTPGYMAPEQARGDVERLDERADVYALGGILHFLLTGRGPDKVILPMPPSQRIQFSRVSYVPGEKLPRALAAIRDKAMAHEPADRYASAEELAADVTRYLYGEAVLAYPENLFEKLERLWPRISFWVVLALTYLVIRALILILQLKR